MSGTTREDIQTFLLLTAVRIILLLDTSAEGTNFFCISLLTLSGFILLTGTWRSVTVKRETQLRFYGNSGYLKTSQLKVIHTLLTLLIVCVTFYSCNTDLSAWAKHANLLHQFPCVRKVYKLCYISATFVILGECVHSIFC